MTLYPHLIAWVWLFDRYILYQQTGAFSSNFLTYCSFPAGLTKPGRRQATLQLQNGLIFTAISLLKSGSV
jgi:hypothetical protein